MDLMPQKLKDLMATAYTIIAIIVLLFSTIAGGVAYGTRMNIKVEDTAIRVAALEKSNSETHKQLEAAVMRIEIYFQYMSNRLEKATNVK